jgi:hypothetical protein
MGALPPAKPAAKRNEILIAAIVVGSLLVALSGLLAIRALIASGITRGPDYMFGDQHLKSSLALIELHKVRYGKYPDRLSNLKFIGQWDEIAINNVSYYPNADRTAYYLEVERGWIGKPNLVVPEEFWQGTGYSVNLNPQKK